MNSIVQDSTGYIWLGTRDGLARYDGYQVKTFHYDPDDSSTIASDVIQAIYPDRYGQLWVLHENRALDIFNPVTEQATHIRADGPLGWLLDEHATEPFVLREDTKGTYWYVSPDLRQIRRFTRRQPMPVQVINPRNERIIALEEGEDGAMYVCTSQSFYVIRDDGLHKIADLPHSREPRTKRISRMVQDAQGNWVIMNNGYLAIYKTDGKWAVINATWRRSYVTDYFVRRAPDGKVYFNSMSQVFRLNSDHSLTRVWANPHRAANIPAMMIDRSGVLWLGTNTYGARYINLSTAGFESFPYGYGFSYNVLTNWFDVPFVVETHRPLADPYLFRYAYDQGGNCWVIGTPFVVRPSSARAARRHPHRLAKGTYAPASFHSDSLDWVQIAFGRDNTCWGIVIDNTGDTLMVRADPEEGTLHRVSSWEIVLQQIGYLTVWGEKLCIVYNDGIQLFDPSTGKSVIYRSKDIFGNAKLLMAVPEVASPDVLWIATLGYGLIKLDVTNGRVEAYTIKDGIPSNSVYAAVFDGNGNLWCSSNKGVFRFNPDNLKVLAFDAGDGLQGNEFNRYHFLRSPKGYIFFGGTRGWTVFHPDSIYVDDYQPATALTGILVNNRPISQLRKWKDISVTAINGLSLNYSQNFVTFNFAAMQFANTEKLNYRYRLAGFDEDWIEIGNQHTANYTNLPPGDYVFEVNSSNIAGIWSSHVKMLPVVIHPPWWKTTLAWVLYALAVLAAGYAFYCYRLNRMRTRQQLIRQQEEARHLRAVDEMKMRFFSNITHEFRTPLSLIIAPLEQISQDKKTPLSIRKKTAGIQENASALLGLINQLLDMSKIEAGNMPVSVSRGELGLFAADQLKGFETQAMLKGVAFDVDIRIRGEYDFDADKWQKIIFNLLSNAIKFTSQGGRVALSLKAGAQQGQSAVELEVSDTGIGIPPEKLAFIFDRFYQVDDSPTRSYGGTGIGLALVRELVELMDGVIDVQSQPGSGTTFRVSIPVGRVSAASVTADDQSGGPQIGMTAGASSVPATAGEESTATRGESTVTVGGDLPGPGIGEVPVADQPLILLVEDNEELNQFIAEAFGKTYRVVSAFDGARAMELVKDELPDLVISDVMMPEMDGYALCQALKSETETDHIAVILLSAKASHDSVIKGLENHADDYITKPFHLDELELRVHNLILRQRKLRSYFHRQLTAEGEQPSATSVGNKFIKHLYSVIEANLGDSRLDVGGLAEQMAVSRRTLNRKLSALIDLSANEVIRRYRLKRAVAMLHSGVNVSETAYRVGFTSIAYFSNSFKDFYGVAPSALLREITR